MNNGAMDLIFTNTFSTTENIQKEDSIKSHSLIKEFIILENETAAKAIFAHFHNCSLLQNQAMPTKEKLKPLIVACKQLNLHLDTTSSKTLLYSLITIFKKIIR